MDPDTVYYLVQQIPYGRVTSYGHIALLANYPNNARQVGQILKYLPTDPSLEYNSETVPWQRVINSQGVVPARSGKENHISVLSRELELDDRGRVDLDRYGWFPEELPS